MLFIEFKNGKATRGVTISNFKVDEDGYIHTDTTASMQIPRKDEDGNVFSYEIRFASGEVVAKWEIEDINAQKTEEQVQ